MKKFYVIVILTVLVAALSMCHKAEDYPNAYDDRLSGGAATVFDVSAKAFGFPIPNLDSRDAHVQTIGDNTFSQAFVAPPAALFPGLGPIYNNISCGNCHRNDGIGIPTAGFSSSGMLFRISVPGTDAHGGPMPAPGFGLQIQDQAVFGAVPEASINITYTDLPVTYPDGSVVTLRQPIYTVGNAYTTLPAGYMISPRLAPPVFGLGLLANIPETTILSFVDAGDRNGDGITGKANYVFNAYTQQQEIGRFGLKANTSVLLIQAAAAYQQDMGITNYVFPQESAYGQPQMSVAMLTGSPELPDTLLNHVAFYCKTLAVPARRDVTDADNKRGEALFTQINCSGCHRPTVQTGVDVTSPTLSNQRIHPYTDLLVHDMGTGLADNRPDYLASGTEWRTTPLWGIGLLNKTTGVAYYLHDGRARTIEEAILWHDGEAKKAKQQFMQLGKDDRNKLLKFLQSL